MKNIFKIGLIAWLILILLIISAKTGCCQCRELSLDPNSKDFCMFYNDKIHVESISSPGNLNLKFRFKGTVHHSMEHKMLFTLGRKSYQLYFPDDNILFTASTTEDLEIGWHLIRMIEVLELYREQKSIVYHKIQQK